MDSTGQSALGIEGRFRCVRHNVEGLVGSGPDGEVTFEDLWAYDEGGRLQPRHLSRVVEDRTVKNKFTRRGLGYFMLKNLQGASGNDQTKMPPEITYPASGITAPNPFLALVLVGDDSGSPTRRGDAKVDWNESDGQYDAKIASGSGTAVYGRRGLLISLTTGIFKRVQLRWPNTSPNFEEYEYTFFAQANAVTQDGPAGGDVGIDNFVCKSIALANAVACGWNEANSQVGLRAILGLAAKQQGISDRVYVHENYVYGDGSASGLGSVTAMHRFTGVETIDTRDGYAASTVIADSTIGSLTADAGNLFTVKASGNIIKFGNAVVDLAATGGFVTAHIRKTLTVANTTSNNAAFTIKRIVSTTEVEVFETVVTEVTPTTATATLATRYTGDKAFDSRVENEGIVTKPAFDVDAAGTIIAGEKYVSSDLPGPHFIARVWPKLSSKAIRGIRITFPKGSIRDFCPDKFIIKYLGSSHGGSGDPQPADLTDWVTVSGQDYSSVSQVANIFDNGEYGYEYHFASPTPATCGIGIFSVVGADTSRKIEVATIYAYTNPSSVTITTGANDALRLSTDGGTNYKNFTCPAVVSTTSVQTICDALNRVLYGWGLECLRSTFGYFWLRATGGGNYTQMHLNTIANSIYATLFPGLTVAGPVARTGLTQPLTKLNTDALTLIYTPRMAGNLPKP